MVNHSKSKTPLQFRYKRNNTPMRIPIIIITLKIIEISLEVGNHTEANPLVDLSEVKIPMVEASKIKGISRPLSKPQLSRQQLPR